MNQASVKKRILPPNLFILSIMIMVLLYLVIPIAIYLQFPYNTTIGIPLLIGGIGLSWRGSSTFSRVKTNIHPFKDPQVLVTSGLYRYSRNPMYLGMLIALIGVWFLLGALSPLIVVLLFYWVLNQWYIPYEEARMKQVFGQAYEQYVRRTGRWF